jgi:hypothetical protein
MVYNKRVRSLRGRIKGVEGVGGWGVGTSDFGTAISNRVFLVHLII